MGHVWLWPPANKRRQEVLAGFAQNLITRCRYIDSCIKLDRPHLHNYLALQAERCTCIYTCLHTCRRTCQAQLLHAQVSHIHDHTDLHAHAPNRVRRTCLHTCPHTYPYIPDAHFYSVCYTSGCTHVSKSTHIFTHTSTYMYVQLPCSQIDHVYTHATYMPTRGCALSPANICTHLSTLICLFTGLHKYP